MNIRSFIVAVLMLTGVTVGSVGLLPLAQANAESNSYVATLYENNLIPNPDFSLPSVDNANWPLHWEANFSLVDFNRPAWDCDIAYAGSCSVRMSAPMETEAAWKSPLIPVQPNTEYRFTGYVRTQSLVPENPRFHGTFAVELHTERGPLFPRPFATGPSFSGDNEWTAVTFDFKTSARATHLQVLAAIAISGRAKGHVWFDAVKLEEVVAE